MIQEWMPFREFSLNSIYFFHRIFSLKRLTGLSVIPDFRLKRGQKVMVMRKNVIIVILMMTIGLTGLLTGA